MFSLTIETDNAAFEDPDELGRLVARAAEQIAAGRTEAPVIDQNGNTVGRWTLDE